MKRYANIFIILIVMIHFYTYSEGADIDIKDASKAKEYYQKGWFEPAAQLWEKQLMVEALDSVTRIQIALNLIKCYQSLADYSKAQLFVQKQLLTLDGRHLGEESLFYSGVGDLYLSMGNIKDAMMYLEKGEQLAIASKHPYALAAVLNNMGNALAASGKETDALATFEECLQLMEDLDQETRLKYSSDLLKATVTINLTRLLLKIEDYSAVARQMTGAFSLLMTLTDSYDKAIGLISLSLLAQQAYRLQFFSENKDIQQNIRQIAFKGLEESKRIARIIENHRIAAFANGYLSRLYEEENRYEEAIYLVRTAIFYSQNYPEILYLWQWQLGKILNKQGQIEQAIQAYQKAVETLNPIRTRFFRGFRSQRDIFNEKVKPVYLGLTDLLLKQASSAAEEASIQEKLIQARDTMELLKTVELQEYFQDECLTDRRRTKPVSIEASDAIIYPIIFPDRLAILVNLSSGIKQVVTPVESKRIEEVVKRFRTRLQFSTNDLYRSDSEQLYQWLIQPIESILQQHGVDTMIFAPDGVLRLIPFSAIYDGKRFLIETYAIATIPALTLTEPDIQRTNQIRMLLDGLSVARHGFAALPNVEKELKDIHTVIQGTILKNEDYTLKNLTREFNTNDYSFVHIATHGVFGGNPNDTYLLTHDSRLTMDQLEQLIDQSRYRGNQVDLLTLSACETAVGDERSAFGLAGIAVKAGVVSAIATLWFVDDVATAQTMAEFYQQMRTSGATKAKSLQYAQLKLLTSPTHHHPAYWAPFLLIGNWR